MDLAPEIIKYSEFTEVNFYDYLYSRSCILKGMNKNISFKGKLPTEIPTKKIFLGRFYHKIIELSHSARSKSQFLLLIEREIDALQAEIDAIKDIKLGSVSGWDEVNLYISQLVKNYSEPHLNIAGISKSETKLFSRDGLMIGKPDYFFIIDRVAYLKEWKSSSLFDDNNKIKEEYVLQVLFYSILLFDNYSIDSVHSSLITPYDYPHEKIIYKDEAEIFRSDLINHIKSINKLINDNSSTELLANVTEDGCKNCSKKIFCPSFRADQYNYNFDNCGYILEGRVDSLSKEITGTYFTISLISFHDKRIIEFTLPSEKYSEIERGKDYIFTNIKMQNGSFFCSPYTKVFLVA